MKLYLPFGGSASTIHACNATAGKQNALVQIYQFLYVRGCDPKFVRGSHTRIKSVVQLGDCALCLTDDTITVINHAAADAGACDSAHICIK